MNRSSLPGIVMIVLVVGACGSAGAAASVPIEDVPAVSPAADPTVARTPKPSVSPPPATLCKAAPGEIAVSIPAQANLFGAGLESPPAPGGGGPGALPALVKLPGDEIVVTFPCVKGQTNCCSNPPTTGPEGSEGEGYRTNVESAGGIAGLVLEGRSMFLAGVFIGDDAPVAPPPERLDLTGVTDFDGFEPQLGQTFFIGNGEGASFVAPGGATRLYLGFVDAMFFNGEPGWYGNNRGALEASVLVTEE